MSLQLILGGSGAGKSYYSFKRIIDEAVNNPGKNYIVVVPEQYTMATQKKLVMLHPRHGILNIDVVSFDRLAYKVFEEVGGQNVPVLDDTGKNLIIRKVLGDNADRLKYFGRGIDKTGFVSEVKSVISEFLQYDITVDYIDKIIKQVEDDRLLAAKLHDIAIVYEEFKRYIKDNYIASEEILEVLCQVIHKSDMIKRSEFLFDGFTGFTPIQYKLLRLLLTISPKLTVTGTISPMEKINVYEGMHNLFFMTKLMYQKLVSICDETGVDVLENIIIKDDVNKRFQLSGNKAGIPEDLSYLEKNIFRYDGKRYGGKAENIRIYEAKNPKDELDYVINEIVRITRFENYRYKDIAIVSGDMATYGALAGNICEQNGIPVFVDNKKSVTHNPFVEFIRSAIEVIEKNYSYESVVRMLRTGFTDLTRQETDLVENYCIATGIKGSRQWNNEWTKGGKGRNAYNLEYMNELRKRIVGTIYGLESVLRSSDALVRDYVTALYTFVVNNDCYRKLELRAQLPDAGAEYEQLYSKVMELFDKVVRLLGNEKISVREFARIIDSGFDEIKVGLLPPSADCVVVGDIERTRLEDIKVLFFVGVNEGVVPKKNENRSILSEIERERLDREEVKLSMTTREKAFVQKFYIYMLLSKPSERLYISYSSKGTDNKGLLPSYVIKNIVQLFGEISIKKGDYDNISNSFLKIPKAELRWSEADYIKTLGVATALRLYGDRLEGSVSSFERFAGCQFAYFLNYGLSVREREKYDFKVMDFGTVIHGAIEKVSRKLKKENRAFSSLSDEERRAEAEAAVEKVTEDYRDTILRDTKRNEYIIKRITDLVDRTIWAVGNQLKTGVFTPDEFEMNFVMKDSDIVLDGNKAVMTMRGKVDRVDICEDDENVYVRIVDYKSGISDLDISKVYLGLKMQLMTYLKAAGEVQQLRHKNKRIIPAGALYYNIDNPIVPDTDGDIDELILEELRMKGRVNSDYNIIEKMDSNIDKKSKVIPVTLSKGGYDSKVLNTEQFRALENYVSDKQAEIAAQILEGNTAVNPYADGDRNPCLYCDYAGVCGFSQDLGDVYRKIDKLDEHEIWQQLMSGMKKENSDNGGDDDNNAKAADDEVKNDGN